MTGGGRTAGSATGRGVIRRGSARGGKAPVLGHVLGRSARMMPSARAAFFRLLTTAVPAESTMDHGHGSWSSLLSAQLLGSWRTSSTAGPHWTIWVQCSSNRETPWPYGFESKLLPPEGCCLGGLLLFIHIHMRFHDSKIQICRSFMELPAR